ncbi:hypothetical protein SAMN04488029_2492 [Reichenbachiella faecimaris]|uniref:Uncharacterized protein n=1 Tax=Reichenbachiella faecimaris TaxID=692418 RepID=A0A1W2GFG0_REIFA|nr:hypothetical protein SAMN04488029_2492 [Reichenbachiella faecimaris]
MRINNIIWLLYVVLVAIAILFNGEEHPFISHGPYPIGKSIIWCAFLAFSGYSYFCSAKESLFRTIKSMLKLHWGRQIGTDLYLGLVLFMLFMFFHQESWLIPLFWLLPVLAFANLATLLYLALHYDSIVRLLLS